MTTKTKTNKTTTIENTVVVAQIDTATQDFFIVGTSPLILHAMSAKGAQDLLYPYKKNAAERDMTRHDTTRPT